MKFTYEYSSTGYRILVDGVTIGGASTRGTATHTSDGRRRSWQARQKDTQENKETAQRVCAELQAGGGPERLRKTALALAEGKAVQS
jgi:hypothetical protein